MEMETFGLVLGSLGVVLGSLGVVLGLLQISYVRFMIFSEIKNLQLPLQQLRSLCHKIHSTVNWKGGVPQMDEWDALPFENKKKQLIQWHEDFRRINISIPQKFTSTEIDGILQQLTWFLFFSNRDSSDPVNDVDKFAKLIFNRTWILSSEISRVMEKIDHFKEKYNGWWRGAFRTTMLILFSKQCSVEDELLREINKYNVHS